MSADRRLPSPSLAPVARRLVLALAALGATAATRAYDAYGAWRDGTITMVFQLDASADKPTPSGGGFLDGSANWNAAITPIIAEWNASMNRTKLAASTGSNPAVSFGNKINNVVFQKKIYGTEDWADRVLAVTYWNAEGNVVNQMVEADVIFNANLSWNSYRGALRVPEEIRRVALHEFGHAIGLDHPDEATPVQNVSAIMNATVSSTDALQTDDRDGAFSLYGTALAVPNITNNLPNRTVAVGANASFTLQINGGEGPAESLLQKYGWFFTPTGGTEEPLFTVNGPVLYLGSAQLDDRGKYWAMFENVNGSDTTNEATLNVTAVATSAATRMTGLSTRGIAGTGSRTMTVGFTITGSGTRRILIRGKGPRLAAYGVPGTLADPVLKVFSGISQIASNDNWEDGGQGATLTTAFTAAGLDTFLAGSKDAAMIANLGPGTYTAQVVPQNGAEGVALIEAYDLDAATIPGGRFFGLSTRGYVGTSSDALTGGLIVSGSAPRTFLIRAIADSLKQYGVTGTLDDPVITLFSLAGGAQKLRVNDDWDSPEFLQPKLTATATTLGILNAAPTDRQESVMQVTLAPGPYTVEVRGFGDTTGVALLEIYEVPEP